MIYGITVRRFAVDAPRDPDEFARRSAIVFDGTHSIADELSWIDWANADASLAGFVGRLCALRAAHPALRAACCGERTGWCG